MGIPLGTCVALLLAAACSAAAWPEPVQPLAGVAATGPSPRSRLAVAECGQARDPARCLALQQARTACQGKRGLARRNCLREKMPAPDCSRSPDPERCQARAQLHDVCIGMSGQQLRRCRLQVRPPRPRSSPASAG